LISCEQNVGQNNNKDMLDIKFSKLYGCRAMVSALDALYIVTNVSEDFAASIFKVPSGDSIGLVIQCALHTKSYPILFIVLHSCISSEVRQDFFASQWSLFAGENCPLHDQHGDLASMS
jgi:hypothetical protein